MLLMVAQCWTMTGGCVQPEPPPGEAIGDGSGGGGDGTGSGGGGNDGSGGGGVATVNDLVAAWAVALGDSPNTKWGLAFGATVSDDFLSLQLSMDGDMTPTTISMTLADGEVNGFWTTTNAEGTLTGALDADGNTIAGSLNLNGANESLTFYRGAKADYRANAVWTQAADGAAAIVAADLDTVLVSVLDAAGDWPMDGRYDGSSPAGTDEVLNEAFFFFTSQGGGKGLFFDDGERLLLVDEVNNNTFVAAAKLFERTDQAGPLTGLWVGLDRPNADGLATRTVRRVVEHGGALYLHESGNTVVGPLTRTQRLLPDGADGAYRDGDNAPGFEWAGQLTPSGNRIVGEWVGSPGWYQSMDRVATPTAADLTGDFGSIDINRTFSDIPPFDGAATMSYDGITLDVTDVSRDGTTSRLQATWQGDHFAGEWWDPATPDVTSPWRGQWLAEGGLLHGLWREGEWSFSTHPVKTTDDVAGADIVFVADPAVDRAMTIVDRVSGGSVAVYRNQQGISRVVHSTAIGDITVTMDERLRPTRIVGPDETIDIVWAATGTDMTATVTDNASGTETTISGTVDYSDAGLIAALNAQETATGRDFSALRDWIQDNPGEIAQIATTGTSNLPELGEAATTTAKARRGKIRVDVSDVVRLNKVLLVQSFLTFGAANFLFVAGGSLAAVTTLIASAGVMAAVLLGFVLADLLWSLLFSDECCTPCGLGCFFSCCSD